MGKGDEAIVELLRLEASRLRGCRPPGLRRPVRARARRGPSSSREYRCAALPQLAEQLCMSSGRQEEGN